MYVTDGMLALGHNCDRICYSFICVYAHTHITVSNIQSTDKKDLLHKIDLKGNKLLYLNN